jgi:hypothetical protein
MCRPARTGRITYSRRQEMTGGMQAPVTHEGLQWRRVAWWRGQR